MSDIFSEINLMRVEQFLIVSNIHVCLLMMVCIDILTTKEPNSRIYNKCEYLLLLLLFVPLDVGILRTISGRLHVSC